MPHLETNREPFSSHGPVQATPRLFYSFSVNTSPKTEGVQDALMQFCILYAIIECSLPQNPLHNTNYCSKFTIKKHIQNFSLT